MPVTVTQKSGSSYSVFDGTSEVLVTHYPHLSGRAKWIAAAQWDRNLMTDPVTKVEAMRNARFMLKNRYEE